MDKKLLFIHESEIVAKGLFTIVNNFFDIECGHLSNIEEVSLYDYVNNSFILFVIDYKFRDKLSLLSALQNKNKTEIVWFDSELKVNSDNVFNLYSRNENIRKCITNILLKFNLLLEKTNKSSDLSEREIDVLKLVAQGFANKEIADKLFISIHTVISHRKNITEKLGIKSISGLTVYAILNKLVEPSSIN